MDSLVDICGGQKKSEAAFSALYLKDVSKHHSTKAGSRPHPHSQLINPLVLLHDTKTKNNPSCALNSNMKGSDHGPEQQWWYHMERATCCASEAGMSSCSCGVPQDLFQLVCPMQSVLPAAASAADSLRTQFFSTSHSLSFAVRYCKELIEL